MYKKDIIGRILLFIIVSCVSFFFKLNYLSIASYAINIVSIASAVYLAAYAGIQASPKLKETLKLPDGLIKNKTQRMIFNSYAKNALIIGFLTMIFSIVVILYDDKLGLQQTYLNIQQVSDPNVRYVQQIANTCGVVTMVEYIISSIAMGLFSINFMAMFNIGKFVINRLSFDR
jgi:hypothetical protein